MASQPPQRLHKPLLKPGAVNYLLAHVEALWAEGVFKGQHAARTVFVHCCQHPGENVPPADREASWRCPVATGYWTPVEIAEATGLDLRSVHRALEWLDAEMLLAVERTEAAPKVQGRRKAGAAPRRGYGPITILSTNQRSHAARTWDKLTQGRSALIYPVPPADGHSALIKGTTPLIDGTEAPPRPRRTVARTRSTWANADGSDQPATLKPEPPGRRPVADARSEVVAPEGCDHREAGLLNTDDTTDSSTTGASSPPSHSGDSTGARTSGRKPTERDSARVRAHHGDSLTDDSLTDVVVPAIAADVLEDSPGYRAGDDRVGHDRFVFELYRDTGDRQHRPTAVA